jgi:crotonyl-CoA reductase
VKQILDAILAGERDPAAYLGLELPESYRGVTVHKDEVGMFDGLATQDKDPRQSLHVDDVACPSSARAMRLSRSWPAR